MEILKLLCIIPLEEYELFVTDNFPQFYSSDTYYLTYLFINFFVWYMTFQIFRVIKTILRALKKEVF